MKDAVNQIVEEFNAERQNNFYATDNGVNIKSTFR